MSSLPRQLHAEMSDSTQLTRSNPTNVNAPPSFLTLPGEIRNAIYEILLVQSEPIDLWHGFDSGIPTGLFRVNKQVHSEATMLFYSTNHFVITGSRAREVAAFFFQKIGARNASLIRHIVIDFPELKCPWGFYADVTIDNNSIGILESILNNCTGLRTLRTSLYSTDSMEMKLSGLHYETLLGDPQEDIEDALDLVDTHFRAFPSQPEIILDVYEEGPDDDLREDLESYGWVLRKHPLPDEEEDTRFSDIRDEIRRSLYAHYLDFSS